jgi:hypothetical protein
VNLEKLIERSAVLAGFRAPSIRERAERAEGIDSYLAYLHTERNMSYVAIARKCGLKSGQAVCSRVHRYEKRRLPGGTHGLVLRWLLASIAFRKDEADDAKQVG